jgi:hypothetical protein
MGRRAGAIRVHNQQGGGLDLDQRVIPRQLAVLLDGPPDHRGQHLVLALETIDLRLQIEDDIDPGQVHAKIPGQRENRLEALTGRPVIQPRVAL